MKSFSNIFEISGCNALSENKYRSKLLDLD